MFLAVSGTLPFRIFTLVVHGIAVRDSTSENLLRCPCATLVSLTQAGAILPKARPKNAFLSFFSYVKQCDIELEVL